ncbi:MAG TPA: translocation/assembly module TamB domain-containing protein [Polyangiaceae bacterium LLY-WYZ-14_1]|nr:translocation/assembly module TamB domain-containing protein [Polyangiaceae bacterium LLY-WYZ-14_1]
MQDDGDDGGPREDQAADRGPGPVRRSRRRRLARALLILLGIGFWSSLFVSALVASALVHLAAPPGRRLVCGVGGALVSDLLVGDLDVGRCPVVRPGRVRLEDAVLRAADGKPVARLDAVDVQLDLLRSLRSLSLVIARVRVDQPWASLRPADPGDDAPGDEGDGQGAGLALVEALRPAEPSEDTPKDDRPPTSGPFILLSEVAIEGGAAADLPEGYAVEGLDLRAGIEIDAGLGEVVVDLASLSARARRDGAPLASVQAEDATIAIAPGRRSELAFRIDDQTAADETGDEGAAADAVDRTPGRIDARLAFDWAEGDGDGGEDDDDDEGSSGPVDLEATVDAVVPPRLLARAAGAPELERRIRTPLRVHVDAAGARPDTLNATGKVETDGGALELSAELTPDRVEATVTLPGFALRPVLAEAAGRLEGEVEVDVPLSGRGSLSGRVDLRGRGLRLPGEVRLDRAVIDGRIEGALPVPELDLRVVARELPLDPAGDNLLSEVNLRVRGGPEEEDAAGEPPRARYATSGSARLVGVRTIEVDLNLGVGVTAQEAPEHPEQGEAPGEGRVAEVDDEDDPDEEDGAGPALVAAGGPIPARIGVDGSIETRGVWVGPLRLRVDDLVVRPAEETLSLRALTVVGTGVDLAADGRLAFGEATRSTATLRIARLDLARLDAALGLDAGLAGTIAGSADVDGSPDRPELDLTVAAPEGLSVPGLSLDALDAQASYSTRRRRASVDVDGGLDDEGGGFDARVDLRLAPGKDPVTSILRGRAAKGSRVRVDRLDLARLNPLLAGPKEASPENASGKAPGGREDGDDDEAAASPPALAGKVSGLVTLSGPLRAPAATVSLRGDDLVATAEVFPADLALDAVLDEAGALTLRLQLATAGEAGRTDLPEARGPEETAPGARARAAVSGDADPLFATGPRLADLRVEAVLPVARAIAGRPVAPTAVLVDQPWSLTIDVPERRLDRLGPPVELGLPVIAEAHLAAAGGPEAPPDQLLRLDGRVRLDAGEPGLRSLLGADVERCAGAELIAVNFEVTAGTETTATVTVAPDGEGDAGASRIFQVVATAPTPLVRWLEEGLPPTPPPLAVDAGMDRVELARIPVACRQVAGSLGLDLQGENLLTPRPELALTVAGDALTFPAADLGDEEVAPVTLRVDTRVDRKRVAAEIGLDQAGRTILRIDGRVPLELAPNGLSGGGLGDGPVTLDARFDETPVAVLTGPVPLFARPGGTIDGEVHVEGRSVETADVSGRIELDDAALTVRDPFLRLQGLRGTVVLEDDELRVEGLRTVDREGKLRVDGDVGLAELAPSTLDLTIELDDYPVRNEGVIFATVNGELRVGGDLSGDPRRIVVRIARLDVELPEQIGREVRGLDPHPQVIYAGEPGFDRSLSVTEALARHQGRPRGEAPPGVEDGEPTPLVLEVRSIVPFWVRQPSFSVQLETDLKVESEGEQTTIRGPVTVRRGFIDIVGGSFQFEEGTINFNGAIPVDPTLDLTATNEVSSGHVVTVRITGHLGDPELEFSSTDPNVRTDAEIIASVLGVRSGGSGQSSQDAESQTGALLAGLTAGFVGSLTRRELGQYLPILSVESGGTAASTRLRAGFQADALIPDALRGVVKGAYVEGVVAGGEDDGDQPGGTQTAGSPVRAGFLIELFFPQDLGAEASYMQPDNWSLDLTWNP